MTSYRNATVILPSPLVEGALAHLRTLEGLDGVTLELERKFPLSVQACQVNVQICPDRCQF